tara:strand:- start:394 stop:675 length:282 start_codon:yes stop_codon:yes gene_type:complete
MEKLLLPAFEIVTSIDPDVEVDEVQLAEQDDAFVDDQVKVDVFDSKTDRGLAVKFTVGIGFEPPPPPQDTIKKTDKIKKNLTCFKITHVFIKF